MRSSAPTVLVLEGGRRYEIGAEFRPRSRRWVPVVHEVATGRELRPGTGGMPRLWARTRRGAVVRALVWLVVAVEPRPPGEPDA